MLLSLHTPPPPLPSLISCYALSFQLIKDIPLLEDIWIALASCILLCVTKCDIHLYELSHPQNC